MQWWIIKSSQNSVRSNVMLGSFKLYWTIHIPFSLMFGPGRSERWLGRVGEDESGSRSKSFASLKTSASPPYGQTKQPRPSPITASFPSAFAVFISYPVPAPAFAIYTVKDAHPSQNGQITCHANPR
ncbi:hypothetical protein MIND_00906100 [Mycena indigotica]|uniref:Uncharacterized protein n=1 Tax=Mycena indigotica TaxID=2126181 RepID=A0A8H6SF93_9AGAR|nr:uncharacterized protein MIND_00906100 [Mycena indigotica]KAF7296755.1 hypothetical protein MIND_00906100 [Mycena indigotica]